MGITEKNLTGGEQLAEMVLTIQDQYREFTLSDLSNAAALLFTEQLEREPGKPLFATDHYQNFSLAFVCQWLNSYRRFRMQAIQTAQRLLPPPIEPNPTEYDRTLAEIRFRITVREAYQTFCTNPDSDEFALSYPEIFALLESSGIYRMENEQKRAIWGEAEKAASEPEKNGMAAVLEKIESLRKGEGANKTRIRRIAMTMACRKVFSELQKMNADISELLRVDSLDSTYDPRDIAKICQELREGAEPVELPYPLEMIFGCVYQSVEK